MKGLGCLGFVVLSLAFVLYLITSVALDGTALDEGDNVNKTTNNNDNDIINNQTYNVLDLGTLEIRDDNLNETDELLEELGHAIESVEYYKNNGSQ